MHSNNAAGKNVSLNASPVTLDLSSSISCPSLSPSPPPYASSVASEQDVNFCDPRNLTVGGVSTTLAPEASTPLASEDFKDDSLKHNFLGSFDFNLERHHNGLPNFDEYSDLEFEDDFVSRLVNLGEQSISDIKRARSATCSW